MPVSEQTGQAGAEIFAAALDFDAKSERRVGVDQIGEAIDAGQFVWLDVAITNAEGADRVVESLPGPMRTAFADALKGFAGLTIEHQEGHIQLGITGCRLVLGKFRKERMTVSMARQFMLTVRRGGVEAVDELKRRYVADFLAFAKTPSFLMYGLWHALVTQYQATQQQFEGRVETVQNQLMGDVDEALIAQVSSLGADLLHFRTLMLPARSTLAELSTHKSPFISETTQPFLNAMTGVIDHVLQDLLVDREILSDSMNLHMSIMAHRTNHIINRLTMLSFFFLPLTFLCGMWGMNFKFMPELAWRWGYLYFFILTGVIVVVQLAFMRWKKWI